MRGLQLMLIAMSVACLIAAITGIRSFTTAPEPGAPSIVKFESVQGRVGALCLGIALGAGAVYLPRRPRLAWWLGCVVGAVAVIDFLYRTFIEGPRDHSPELLFDYLLPLFAFSIVAVYWGMRWYRRRSNFVSDDDANA